MSQGRKSSYKWLIVLGFGCHFLLSFGVMSWYRNYLYEKSTIIFNNQAVKASVAATDRLESYSDLLYAVRGLFAAYDNVSKDEWQTFINSLHVFDRYPSVIRVQYTARIPDKDVLMYENLLRAQFPEFTGEVAGITSTSDGYTWIPVYRTDRDNVNGGTQIGTPVTETNRLVGLAEVVEHGVPYVIESEYDEGRSAYYYIVLLPIYSSKADQTTVEGRTEGAIGAVSIRFDLNVLMDTTFERYNELGDKISLSVFDNTIVDTPKQIYSNGISIGGDVLGKDLTVNLANRSLLMRYESTSNYGTTDYEFTFIGLVFIFMIAVGLWLALGTYAYFNYPGIDPKTYIKKYRR